MDTNSVSAAPAIAGYSPGEVVHAIRENLREYYRCLGRSPAVAFHQDAGLGWLATGITPLTYLNAVFYTNLPMERIDQAIHATIAAFRSREIMRFSWWVDDNSPLSLPSMLQAHCFFYVAGESGMALDLRTLGHDLPHIAGLQVVTASGYPDGIAEFARVSIHGFELPGQYYQRWLDIHTGLEGDMALRSYIACLDGAPVGCAQLFLGTAAAGIYDVAVLPGWRGRGLGAAITAYLLQDALRLGASLAILHASPMGESVYLRLGFRPYCRMQRFVWDGEHVDGLENHRGGR